MIKWRSWQLNGTRWFKKKVVMFCSRTGPRVGWKAETSLKQFCIFSWDFPPVLLWPSPKTTSSQIAFRAFTLYELNVCAVYMQACAKWIKNGNKNEKESSKRLRFMTYLYHLLQGTWTIKTFILFVCFGVSVCVCVGG